jgi:hypothetical protein
MTVGDWFRRFGPSSEDYFELVHATDGVLTFRHYHFNRVTGHVGPASEHQLTEKEWLDLRAENEIVEISKNAVPFLMPL